MSKNKKKIVEVSDALRASTFDTNVHAAAPKMILDEVIKSKADKKKELKDDHSFVRHSISSINRRTNPHHRASSSCYTPSKGPLLSGGRANNRIMPKPNKKLGGRSNGISLVDSDIERSLQEEITELLLLRLPAMELVRHKKLQPIISSPRFVSAHLKLFKSDPSTHYVLLRDCLYYETKVLPLGPIDSILCCTSQRMVIVGSVNGLICFAGDGDSSHSLTPDDIFILNPVTRLSRKLPSPSVSRITPDTLSVNLAFWWDRNDSDSTTGGCDGVYKVAKIVPTPDGQCVLEVWTSGHPDKWTHINTLDFDFNYWATLDLLRPCDALIEGDAAYWMVQNPRGYFFVLSLDLKTLGVKFIPLSAQQMCTQSELYAWRAEGDVYTHLFGASWNGKFVLLRNRFSGDRMYDMWMMERKGGGPDWVKRRRGIRLGFRFLGCAGSINGKLILRGVNDILVMYDMKTGRRTRLVQDYSLKYVRILSAHDFVGSLVSIEGFEYNELPAVGITWPSPYYGASGWVKKENVYICEI